MQLLAAALVMAPCALLTLVWVRSKSDGEEPNRRTNGIAWTASLAAGSSLALGTLAAVELAPGIPRLPADLDGWQRGAAVGAMLGLALYLCMRVFVFGVASALHRWSCRLPREFANTFGHQLLVELCALAGFVLTFVLAMSLAFFTEGSNIAVWALLPLCVAILPLYNTLLLPWIQFLRAPRSSSRDLTDIEAWLDSLRRRRKLPRFRVRVQEGRLANAFATGGLGAHLVVIGGGLLDRMSNSQLCAVLAHEVAHVEKGHVPRLVLPLAIVGTSLHVLCVILFANPLFDKDELLFVLAGAALAGAFAGLFLAMLPGFFMRKMEFQADALAVEMLHDGEQLVDALTRLAEINKQPLDARSWSHPSMQARIDAIRGLTPDARPIGP